MVLYFSCLFSYPSLLELHYGGRMNMSQTAREQAMEVGLSVREAEQRLDAKLFLDEYPRWELRAPHWSIILHEMFVHGTEWGKKEAERFIHWGHWGSIPRPDLEADQSAMDLVGYQTSHKEIWDIYHSVCLLRRSPGLPPCGSQQRREAIHDILSSLRSQLHQWVYPTATKETWGPVNEHQSRPRRRGDLHKEALWEVRAACQRVLEATQVLKSDMERLSQGMRDVSWTQSRSCSRSHPQSCSLDRWLRSPSRSWQERRVTFQELEVEPDSKEGGESYPPQPSLIDVETWLDWQACQLDTLCWWMELTAIPDVEDPWKLTQIWASFSIPEVRNRVFQWQDYTAHPAPKCLTWNVFLPDELSYQDGVTTAFSLNCCLCPRVTVLGRETQPARGPRFLPLGEKYHRVEREGERACRLYQMVHHPGLREGQPRDY